LGTADSEPRPPCRSLRFRQKSASRWEASRLLTAKGNGDLGMAFVSRARHVGRGGWFTACALDGALRKLNGDCRCMGLSGQAIDE
jgi:hypothetical protein